MDRHRARRVGRGRVAGQDHGVHEHAVVLQADCTRVHREAHHGLTRVRGPDLQDPAQGETALVGQGPAGLDVEVVEALQQEGAQRAPEARRRAGQQFVEIRGTGRGPMGRVEAQRALECAVLRPQTVAVAAPGHGRAAAHDGAGQLGGVALPLGRVRQVTDAEAAADVDGARLETTNPQLLHGLEASFERRRLLVEARGVEVVADTDRFQLVPVPFEDIEKVVQGLHRRTEAASPRERSGSGRLEPGQAQQDTDARKSVGADETRRLLQLAGTVGVEARSAARGEPEERRVLGTGRHDPGSGEPGPESVPQFAERRGVEGRVRRGETAHEGGTVRLVGEVDPPGQPMAVEYRTEAPYIVGDLVRQEDVQRGAQSVHEGVQELRRVQESRCARFQPWFQVQRVVVAHPRCSSPPRKTYRCRQSAITTVTLPSPGLPESGPVGEGLFPDVRRLERDGRRGGTGRPGRAHGLNG